MRVLAIHRQGDTTKVAAFAAPVVSQQLLEAGVAIELRDEVGGPRTGTALFHKDGLVVLVDAAIDQYGSLSQPNRKENVDVQA